MSSTRGATKSKRARRGASAKRVYAAAVRSSERDSNYSRVRQWVDEFMFRNGFRGVKRCALMIKLRLLRVLICLFLVFFCFTGKIQRRASRQLFCCRGCGHYFSL